MVKLIWSDELSLVAITSTHMPDLGRIQAAWPRRPRALAMRQWREFMPSNAALATTLNALAWRYLESATTMPVQIRSHREPVMLDSYVVSPTAESGGGLDEWFAAHLNEPNYRVVINRQPATVAGVDLPYLWQQAYCDSRLALRCDKESRVKLRECTEVFAVDLLKSYHSGDPASTVSDQGYDFAFARLGASRL